MIPIWKLTVPTYRLGIPKFSKISFTMAVHRNAVIKLHKSRKSNVEIAKRQDINHSMVWKIVKKFQETENTLGRQGAEENGVSASLNSSETRGSEACRRPSPGEFSCIFWLHEPVMATWFSVKLMAMQHLEGLHPQIVPHTGCGGQDSAATARDSSQLFPRVFEELRETDTPFSSAPWSVRVFPVP